MTTKHIWEKMHGPDDPQRCQGITPQGQCINRALPGLDVCAAHGGALKSKTLKEQSLRNYRLMKFKERASELSNSDGITSLKDEVALLRMLIEERINQCNDSHELLLVSGPLSDLIIKVEKVVSSCHRLDSKLGNLLDKTKVLLFAQVVVEIVGTVVTDPEQLDIISDKILKALEEL